jgi:hypothetical protein
MTAQTQQGRRVEEIPVSVETLYEIIRVNRESAEAMLHSIRLWMALREIINGAAPPPILVAHMILPGLVEPVPIEIETAALDPALIVNLFVGLANREGERVLSACNNHKNLSDQLARICNALTTPPPPVPPTPRRSMGVPIANHRPAPADDGAPDS